MHILHIEFKSKPDKGKHHDHQFGSMSHNSAKHAGNSFLPNQHYVFSSRVCLHYKYHQQMQLVVDVQVNHGAECSVGDDYQKEPACT